MRKLNPTEKKVYDYIEEHDMIKAGDKVVVGVSGGADSLCLLFLLIQYSERVPFSLYVVHVNHLIRTDAARDADYVKSICEEYEIPFYLKEVDVRRMAKNGHLSEEEAGRNARYSAFEEVAKETGAGKIAVAHNKNDRAETFLFNLFRGSSLNGLGSIRPVRGNIIRPILCLERKEAEEYLNERNIEYCIDSTNMEDDYSRNRIRHNVLPYVEEEIFKGSTNNISRAAKELSEAEEFLDALTNESYKKCTQNGRLLVSKLSKEPAYIQKRIIYKAIVEACGKAKDISSVHVEKVRSMLYIDENPTVSLPYETDAVREYDEIVFYSRNNETISLFETGILMHSENEQYEIGNNHTVMVKVFKKETENAEFPTDKYTKWFDYDKIDKPLIIRTRKTGDYMTLSDGEGHIISKSLKDYMITEKIPARIRDTIPLLACGEHIVWTVGYRISEYFKTDSQTKTILEIKYI